MRGVVDMAGEGLGEDDLAVFVITRSYGISAIFFRSPDWYWKPPKASERQYPKMEHLNANTWTRFPENLIGSFAECQHISRWYN